MEHRVRQVIELFSAALQPDYIVIGGGNAELLQELPPNCRLGDNANAFTGGFRLWQERTSANPRPAGGLDGDLASKNTLGRSQMTTSVAPLWTVPPGAPCKSTSTRSRTSTCGSCSQSDPTRGERLAAEAVGVYLDYSKNRITDETLQLLVQLAEESGLAERIEAMFRGEKINVTEDRAVLHVALRAPRDAVDRSGRPERRARRARRARQDGRLRRSGAQRRLEGSYRQADPQRGQHRHRRLRPRTGDGLRGLALLQPAAT